MSELDELRRRIADLERELRLIGRAQIPKQVRLAKTVEDPNTETYPSAGANTYWIVFLDGTFTEEDGDQTATYTNRQNTTAPRTVAHVPIGDETQYIDEGSRVIVFAMNGRWWILGQSDPTFTFGKLDSDLAYSNSTGVTVSVYSDPATDSGSNIDNVKPPPWMTEGTLKSGLYIQVVSWGGNYYAIDLYLPLGTNTNDIMRWNATTGRWVVLTAPSSSGTWALTVTSGTMGWTECDECD